ncbi:MAG: triose-phosphate isomerase family protein, partial [bacterium]
MRRPLVVANWKMNMTVSETHAFFVAGHLDLPPEYSKLDIAIAPPLTALTAAKPECEKRHLLLCAQNCHTQPSGAFTGEVSAAFLNELGCAFVICGHSERRTLFGEGEFFVAEKVRRVLDSGMQPILCIGETLEERQAGHTERKLAKQLDPVLKLLKR